MDSVNHLRDAARRRPRSEPGVVDEAARLVPGRFQSILNPRPDGPASETPHEAPPFFHDLHLDRIVSEITAGWEEYDLAPYFFAPAPDLDTIAYRQEVMRDLERASLRRSIDAFSGRFRLVRRSLELVPQLDHEHERTRWFLDAARLYCEAVDGLAHDLDAIELASRGFRWFRDYLAAYRASARFTTLAADARELARALTEVRYDLLIEGDTITVLPHHGEADYTTEVMATFEKFRFGATAGPSPPSSTPAPETGRLSHVEAEILDRVVRLHPSVFHALDRFAAVHAELLDPTITRFAREIQFYVAYLRYTERFRTAGLPFCYPQVSGTSKAIHGRDAFDLALASTLLASGGRVVCNHFELRDPERILVITGPNHGGKTTFARMVGQLHYLARLGCSVPGTEARLFCFDRLFTHFERGEDVRTLRGKLQDDLLRLRAILDQATPESLVIINEIFASTTVRDALALSRKLMAALARLDLLAVCVTFLDELASFDRKTASFVSTVDPRDPTVRTFVIERRPPDGLAYALAIAEKHRVTYDWLARRIRG
jgi:DNA mismatch repair protein MutS